MTCARLKFSYVYSMFQLLPELRAAFSVKKKSIKTPNSDYYFNDVSCDCLTFFLIFMQDLYIGANVEFHRYKFVLIDADEYAVMYMEKHSSEFPQANIQFILPKLKQILESKYEEVKSEFQRFDQGNSGKIPASRFR